MSDHSVAAREHHPNCRCATCRDNKITPYRHTRRLDRFDRGDYIPGHDPIRDTLMTFCWCYRKLVPVPRRDVLHGLTGSCGHRDCAPADG